MKSLLLRESFRRSRMMKRISKNSIKEILRLRSVKRIHNASVKSNFKNKSLEK